MPFHSAMTGNVCSKENLLHAIKVLPLDAPPTWAPVAQHSSEGTHDLYYYPYLFVIVKKLNEIESKI